MQVVTFFGESPNRQQNRLRFGPVARVKTDMGVLNRAPAVGDQHCRMRDRAMIVIVMIDPQPADFDRVPIIDIFDIERPQLRIVL